MTDEHRLEPLPERTVELVDDERVLALVVLLELPGHTIDARIEGAKVDNATLAMILRALSLELRHRAIVEDEAAS